MSLGRTTHPRVPFVFVSAFISIVLFCASALGQNDSNPKYDWFIGYQWLNPGGTVPLPGNPSNPTPFKLPSEARGIGTAFGYNFDSHWAAEGDFGYNRDTGSASSVWTVGGGPRFTWRTDYYSVFIHALGTLNRLTYENGTVNNNGFGTLLGGGMYLPF